MSDTRQPPTHTRSGRPIPPGEPTPPVAKPATTKPTTNPTADRQQPPLQEVLKGLDARELESESMFDQLFGPLADGGPRQPGRDDKR